MALPINNNQYFISVFGVYTDFETVWDPLLIFTLDMGISGAAWATIIAQLVTAIMVIHHFLSKKSQIRIEMNKLKLHFVTIKSILSIGFAPFAMQLSSVVVSIISNNALKTYGGDVAIGAMTIINSVMVLFLMSAIGVDGVVDRSKGPTNNKIDAR